MNPRPLVVWLLAAQLGVGLGWLWLSEREKLQGRDPERASLQLEPQRLRLEKPADAPSTTAPAFSTATPPAGTVAPTPAPADPSGQTTEPPGPPGKSPPDPSPPEGAAATPGVVPGSGGASAPQPAVQERSAAEAAAREKAAREKAEQERAAAEKAERDKADKERLARNERDGGKYSCVEFVGVPVASLRRLEQQIGKLAPNTRYTSRLQEGGPPESFVVYLPAGRTRAETDRTLELLKAAGIRDFAPLADASGGMNGISLGVFTSEERARNRVKELAGKGFGEAQVVPRSPPAARLASVQIRDTDEASALKLSSLRRELVPTAEFRPCRR